MVSAVTLTCIRYRRRDSMAGMTMPLAALPARAALNAPASSSRKPSPWFALLSTAALLVVTAVALVRIHPLEARQTVLASSGSLFATALASQRRDHAKKLKEVEKAKKDMREKLDGEEGESHHHHLSDAALLRQAVKAQQRDEMKARKAAATMKEQLKAKSSFTAMPSQHETLSDAKLYQDALKEQKQDRQKREAATKKTAVVQAKKIQRLQAIKKAEQQKKLQAELKFIISASDVSSKSKVSSSRSRAPPPTRLSRWASRRGLRGGLTSLQKHLTSRAKSSHVHSKDVGGDGLTPCSDASLQLLDKAGEMNLVKYLDSQGGSKVRRREGGRRARSKSGSGE
eukprot:753225-Hanusia_phi.AAC.5